MEVQFVVAPHRGQFGSGIWATRRDGVLVGVHPSRDGALRDAVARAFDEWNRSGHPAAVFVEWMGGEKVLARDFGRARRTDRPDLRKV
jgi:hypothetical protein